MKKEEFWESSAMKSVNIVSIIIWVKEIIQKIAVTNYAINQKMKLQCN